MLGIYFGLLRSQHSNKLGMHTFIQNVSDLSEHVWKAAGLQHDDATDLPLCKSSSSQTSMLLTCIARCGNAQILSTCAEGFHINYGNIFLDVSIAVLKIVWNAHIHPEHVGSVRACLESCRITTCLRHRPSSTFSFTC